MSLNQGEKSKRRGGHAGGRGIPEGGWVGIVSL